MSDNFMTYVGTKIIDAEPMTRGEYNKYRGWTIPANENPDDEGYLVQYRPDGYISWSPKKVFEEAYKGVDEGMTFGGAIHMLKRGCRVARKGWNGKGMFVYLVPAAKYPANRNKNKSMVGMFPDDLVPYRAYLAIKTAQNDVCTWAPSVSDTLAEDWIVVG